jgi:uncharacterized phage protein (predicted DNA packaging)
MTWVCDLSADAMRRRLRIDTDLDEDDDLEAIIEQAKSSVINSVDSTIDESEYEKQPLFERAVLFLFAEWYFNNIPVSDGSGTPTAIPFSVNMVITQLKGMMTGGDESGSDSPTQQV